MKPTKRDHFITLLNIPAVRENEMLVEFIHNEIALIDKRSAAPRKPTPKQKENAGIKEMILEVMEPNKHYLPGDFIPLLSGLEITSPRIVALLTQLYEANEIHRVEIKRKNYYCLPEN